MIVWVEEHKESNCKKIRYITSQKQNQIEKGAQDHVYLDKREND